MREETVAGRIPRGLSGLKFSWMEFCVFWPLCQLSGSGVDVSGARTVEMFQNALKWVE